MFEFAGFDAVMESIHSAVSLNFASVKLNSVVIKGVNDMELMDFVRLTKDLPLYVRFIEYMPFGGRSDSNCDHWRRANLLTPGYYRKSVEYRQVCVL